MLTIYHPTETTTVVFFGVVRIDGACDSRDLETLRQYLKSQIDRKNIGREFRPGDRCMFEVIVHDPGENARNECFAQVEKCIQEVAPSGGWSWRISSRNDEFDRHVIDSRAGDWSDMMHDLGAKGRRRYEEATAGTFSAYYTGTFG